ncbi:mechanosensitive ion channel family protein [Algoriphagus machipongonensis]|uniref:Mechanosensitive ion channel family protein n=1 Tax=Algoriphagus machipongonensis TaxID=388413 RepID=A3HYW0_9BACT|nr:mechanosensitive ion channel family protein [Algoriphagus machipongonensis]EAZ80446.1 mechanosensitive ion channel family protein [Algoriphagus machipongonensis]
MLTSLKRILTFAFFLLLSVGAFAQSGDTTAKDTINSTLADSLQKPKVYPVVFYEDTLFYIGAKLGPFSQEERATNFSNKLDLLLDAESLDTTLLSLSQDEVAIEILHGDIILGSVTAQDAAFIGNDQEEIAEFYIQSIKDSYAANHNNRSFIQNLTRTGLLIGVIIIVILLVRFINKGFNKLIDFILRRWHHYFKGIKVRDFELLSAEREERVLKTLMRVVKILLIIILLYLALPLVFSIFPTTKRLASVLLGYVTNPLVSFFYSFFSYLPDLFTILVIVVITYYIGQFISFISEEIERGNLRLPGFYPEWAKPTFNLVKIIVFAFSFIVIFPYLPGSDSPAFQGVSVFLGLLISLGSSSAISNIIAGLVIIYMRAFKIGDRVKIGDTTGDVIEKTMLVTRLRTIKNEEVTIPNSSILNGNTINYSVEDHGAGLILHSTVTIGYDVPWRKVHELLIGAALEVESIIKEPKPFVLQTSLDDYYVSYQINAYTANTKIAAKSYSDLHANIQDAFQNAGVEIMSPHYRAQRDGNELTIPPTYIPEEKKPEKEEKKAEEPKGNSESPPEDDSIQGMDDATYS